ncbi:hypothetical protein Rwratislav_16437 [Rhodococcus wratislaviensis IFP 2016]|nr:hypothetical protein Rwratislav_16437 [Rhodococcus wratislaviensis IFP 2016]
MPAAVLATAVLLAGCSNADTTAEPTGKSGGDQIATASVDTAALDTGSYPTSPAPEFGRATQETILDVDGQRLAEFTVVPFEIDPELTSVKMPTMVMRSGKNLGVVLSDAAGDIAHTHQMLYGYVSTAATPTTKTTDPSRSVVQAVMRFNNPEDAAATAREIHQNLLTVDDGTGLETAENIDILPNTLVSTGQTNFDAGPEVSVNAFTPHGDYLLYTWAKAPAADKDWTAKAVAKSLQLQEPLIDQFPATPTRAQNGGQSAQLPMIDQDKVLIYALPEEDAQAQLGDDMAAYGPRGMAHRSTNPPLTFSPTPDPSTTPSTRPPSTGPRTMPAPRRSSPSSTTTFSPKASPQPPPRRACPTRNAPPRTPSTAPRTTAWSPTGVTSAKPAAPTTRRTSISRSPLST